MTEQEFKAQVEEFAGYHCHDYFDEYEIDYDSCGGFDPDDPLAYIKLKLYYYNDETWDVPIIINSDEEIGVQAHEDSTIGFDGEALFTWLFFEAESKLRAANERIKELEQARWPDEFETTKEAQNAE